MSSSPDATAVDGWDVRKNLYKLHGAVSDIKLPTWENPLRLLVTGSRDWVDFLVPACVFSSLSLAYGPIRLMHGGARGLDTVSDRIFRTTPGWPEPQAIPADWSHGKIGGNIRNQDMVDKGHDMCIGFPFRDSTGTPDCLDRAYEAKIPTFYVWGYEIKPWKQIKKRRIYKP